MRVQRQSKREYLARMQARYLKATKREKGALLDEVVAVTGYHRRHAVRVLRHGRFPDPRLAAVQGMPAAPARRRAGAGAGGRGCTRRWWWARCASRRRRATGCAGRAWRPSCPSWCRRWRPRGRCGCAPEDRAQLLAMSARTIDRRLRPFRLQRDPRNWHGLGTTKPGTLLKHQVPVQTYTPVGGAAAGLPGDRPGGPLRHHDRGLLPEHPGRDRRLPAAGRSASACGARASGRSSPPWRPAAPRLPMPLLGLDSDNGGEFLNAHLVRYCTQERAHLHPQPPLLEERPGPRGAEELVGRPQARRLRALRERGRPGRSSTASTTCSGSGPTSGSPRSSWSRRSATTATGKTRKTYDAAQTPYRRLLASGALDAAQEQALAETFAACRPMALRRQLAAAVEQLGRLQERPNERYARETDENALRQGRLRPPLRPHHRATGA